MWKSLEITSHAFFRSLLGSPAFSAVAILSLALGIGANSAIFTLIDAVMLRMLPVAEPEQLVELDRFYNDRPSGFSYPLYEQLRDRWQDSGIASVTRIGDCWAPSTIQQAVYTGHKWARELDEEADGLIPRELPMIEQVAR